MKQAKRGFTIIELVMVIAISVSLCAFAVVASLVGVQVGNESNDHNSVDKINHMITEKYEKFGVKISDSNEFYTAILTNKVSSDLLVTQRIYRKFIFDPQRQVLTYTNNDYVIHYPDTLSNIKLSRDITFEVSKSLYEAWLRE